MGRRNREHIVIVSFVENNVLKQETINCDNLYEALEHTRLNHSDIKSVQIFDCLGNEIHANNKHILDFIPEEIESIQIIENEKVEDKEEIEEIESIQIIENKVEEQPEVIKKIATKKTATKKSVAKKVTTKKVTTNKSQ